MPICEICRVAIIKLRPQDQRPWSGGRDVDLSLPLLGSWILRDCWVCNKFSKWLKTKHLELFNSWHVKELPVTYSLIHFSRISRPQDSLICLFMLNITARGLDPVDDACELEVNLVPEKDFGTRQFTLPKRRCGLALPSRWLENCRRNHVKCERKSDQWYPTRLLHFGRQGRKLKLVMSKDQHGPYVSLSHRWSTHMNFKLTPTTMAQLQRGVELSKLSRVFRDSVTIAQHLGIHYLWIDALCIKQDEDGHLDWNIESKNMNDVYANALLNISATWFQGDESLFEDRDQTLALPSEIQIDIDGIPQSYFILDSDIWRNDIDNAPLNNRAWVFQERFSARRVLHFGRQQITWECRESETSEMFPDGHHPITTASYITKPTLCEMLMNQSNNFARDWHTVVENYSKCGLTESKDKLIAFDGVAQAVMTSQGGRCVAGVWQHNIAYDLSWFRFYETELLFPIAKTLFRAPSWSWACVDGPVYYPAVLGKIQRLFVNGGEILEPDANENTSLSKHPSIRVQCQCLLLKIKWLRGEMANFETAGLKFRLGTTFGAEVYLDGSEKEAQELVCKSKVHWIPLFATTYSTYGVILAKLRGVHMYRRIGALEISTVDSYHPHELILRNERKEYQGEKEGPPAGSSVGPAATDPDFEPSPKWNWTALQLVYQKLDKLKPSLVIIC